MLHAFKDGQEASIVDTNLAEHVAGRQLQAPEAAVEQREGLARRVVFVEEVCESVGDEPPGEALEHVDQVVVLFAVHVLLDDDADIHAGRIELCHHVLRARVAVGHVGGHAEHLLSADADAPVPQRFDGHLIAHAPVQAIPEVHVGVNDHGGAPG